MKKYAFFSQKHAELMARNNISYRAHSALQRAEDMSPAMQYTNIWFAANGTEVNATAVANDDTADWYDFDDKVCLGEVIYWVCFNQTFMMDLINTLSHKQVLSI